MAKNMYRTGIIIPLLVMISMFSFGHVGAHDIPISKLHMVPDDSQLHLELRLNLFELKFISEIDQNKNREIEKGEFEENAEAIKQRILKSLKLKFGGQLVRAKSAALTLDESHHLIFRAHYPIEDAAQPLELTSELQSITNQSHVTLVEFGKSDDKQLAKLDNRLNSATFSPLISQTSGDKSATYMSAGNFFILLAISIILVGGIIWAKNSKRVVKRT